MAMMMRQYELVERVKAYDPDVDEDLLNRAYVFAMKAHGSQTRASGDPYFSHPIEVAGILTGMKLDAASIATALLHDVIEDTDVTYDEISELFGEEIAKLVNGVTKLSLIEMQGDNKQAENFGKLILAMSEDIRVLLVKLADRVHNMRTLHHISKPEKRYRIASETLDIYVPLAERIGIHQMKDELQDLAFKYMNPDARDSILVRLSKIREADNNIVDKVIKSLDSKMTSEGIKADISGREKKPYSIWLKMQRMNVGFEQLCDIMAFRVIVDTVGECYHALGVIHSSYAVLPDRFKDYISTPKPNGYASLHTSVIGPENQRIEIQIRTKEMHEVSELGVAAHWSYKQGVAGPQTEGKQYRWLRELLEILEDAEKPDEFLEDTKMELFQDQVFCFSPKGDLIELPRGATPVDFAYAVHSEVGDKCVGVRVNNRMVPLHSELNNGDQVEVITSKNQTPSPTWERFVVTGKARARIRRFVRLKQRDEYLALGKAMLQKVFKTEKQKFSEKALSPVIKKYNMDHIEDFYAGIGSGNISARDVFNAVYPDYAKDKIKEAMDAIDPEESLSNLKSKKQADKKGKKAKGKSSPLPIKGLIPGMAVHYARCCHPLPGDKIVGIVMTGKGVTIHTKGCDTLETFADTPERFIDVSWEEEGSGSLEEYVGRLTIEIMNEKGGLGTLSTIIATHGGDILNFKVTSRATDFWTILIDIRVGDLKELTDIMAALRASSIITSVERAH